MFCLRGVYLFITLLRESGCFMCRSAIEIPICTQTLFKIWDGFAWKSQILLFLTLGLLVNQRLVEVIVPAYYSFFMIVLPVLLRFSCVCSFRKVGFKDKLYISWVDTRPYIFHFASGSGVPAHG